MIEWKAFWAATATILSLSLAALTVVGAVSPILPVVLAVIAAVAVVLVGHLIIDACERFRRTETWQRRRIWLGTSSAAVLYAAWIITTIFLPVNVTYLLIMAAILGVLGIGTYWTARGIEWRLTYVAPPKSDPDDQQLLAHKERVMAAALHRAEVTWVKALPDSVPLRDNAGRQFRVRVKSRSTLDKKDQSGARAELSANVTEPIAIALGEITGRQVKSDWVRLRKEDDAGIYSITVANRDVMAEVIEYVDDPTPTSITTPALVGIEIDGREHYERQDQHQRDVGSSTAGKSSLLHLKIAHITKSTDAVLWVAGVQKLYDLVAGWVEPYHNTGLKPPIDWIGHGPYDTLEMMAAAMRVARWRQRQPMSQRKWRKIIVILDEFSFVAQLKAVSLNFEGERANASWLASALLRGAASGDVHIHFATQRSTTDHFGDQGGDVIANIAVNHGFRSKDFLELGRLTGDYKLPPPKHQGEFYSFTDADPLHLKAPYIQTTDPSKDRLHDGATIADVSWSRRHLVQGGLTEAEGAEATGDAYADRYQQITDHMMAYLTQGPIEDTNDTETDEVYQQTRAELAAIAEAAGLDLSDNDPAPAATSTTSACSREDRIIAVLEVAHHEGGYEALDADQIAAGLGKLGDNASPNVVTSTMSRLVKAGRISRTGRGLYGLPQQTNEQTNA